MNDLCASSHEWQGLDGPELKTLRSKAKRSRPSGAWLESAERCRRCGSTQAQVSWFGYVIRVPVDQAADGQTVVRWPGARELRAEMGMG